MFKPALTPVQLLTLGVFSGRYFTPSERAEFPTEWFINESNINLFGVESGQSRNEWIQKGWITPEDPLGWFQWYCRYSVGRRIPSLDTIQIGRHRAFARHAGGVRKNGGGNLANRRRQRQALLQWAYNPLVDISEECSYELLLKLKKGRKL